MMACSKSEAGESTRAGQDPSGLSEPMSLVLDCDKSEKVPSRELRRRRQEAYRRDLSMQIVEDAKRREWEATRVQQLEQQHELKSVRAARMSAVLVILCGVGDNTILLYWDRTYFLPTSGAGGIC